MTAAWIAAILTTLLVALVFVLSLFWRVRPVLIAEGTDSPEDEDETDPSPVDATYDLLAELRAKGAPMEELDGVLDAVIALGKERTP